MKVAVVDYEAGNLRSVETALSHLGADFFVSPEPKQILKADAVIFPGVGEARSAMEVLALRGLGEALRETAHRGKPLFGICLGSQIVLSRSEERDVACLDLIPGVARRFADARGLKIPHMGWNTLKVRSPHPVFDGLPEDSSFYFVHSYYPDPSEDSLCIGTTEYGREFCAAFALENVVATQFHPEKSGKNGLLLLRNFLEL
ncbi:MAG: imidazole glycerol phosphate synthase subunit HisH [Spirochaetaceae bacterium]